MADRKVSREQSSDEVKSHLSEGLKSCTKLVDSYRQLLKKELRPLWKGWKH
jgi:hypothetical protein